MSRVTFEYEVEVLRRGFLAAYGRLSSQAAVAVWLAQTSEEARRVMEAVVLRLRHPPARPGEEPSPSKSLP